MSNLDLMKEKRDALQRDITNMIIDFINKYGGDIKDIDIELIKELNSFTSPIIMAAKIDLIL